MAQVQELISYETQPETGGACAIFLVFDPAVSMNVIRFDYYNTMLDPASFTITRVSDGRTRSVTINPSSGSSTAPLSVAPPFAPGNWTPTMMLNPGYPDDSPRQYIENGWVLTEGSSRRSH